MGLIADIHRDLEFGALQLIVEYRARLHVEAVKLCGDETQADDLVFRTFEQVLAKVDSYKVDTNLFGWMKSIMENIHLNDVRRPVDRRTKAVPPEDLEQCAGADWSTDEQLLKNSDSEALREALHGLDPKYHKVLLMRYYQELSMRQIAEILRLPLGTVTRRVQIAHELLAGKLRAEFGKVKKPLAVLLAALFGAGALFGAWQTGLLAPFLQRSGEAESFPLQDETFQRGEADQSKEATKSGESNQSGEAYPPSEASCEAGAMRGESFPLHGGAVSTQLQSQSETGLTQEESQSETKKEQVMNTKTVKAVVASAVAAIAGAVSGTTYNVPADGTLNEVVPAAQSGDEVVIAASETPYVLTAALTVPAGVTVRGATGDFNDVVISGGGACAGLTLTQGTSASVLTAVSNLTITSCASTGGTAGLVVKKWAVAENCRVTGCWATGQWSDGGVPGIGVNLAANSAVKRCVIDGNYTLDTYDGLKAVGLYVSGASTVSDTVITNNYAPKMRTSDWSRMGSAGVRAAKGATFTRCYFANNRIGLVTTGANSVGTALFVDDYAYLYNCTFEHNDYECAVADNVYAVILASNSNTKMENCVILENRQADGALNNISIGASCADVKFSNNASDGVLESIESKVSIVVTEDDFVRVGGLLRPKPNTPASGLGAMPDWDGVTPADPLPPAPSTNLVSDITLLQAAIDAAKPGDVVQIAKGTYTVTAQINVRNGVIVEGATGNRDDVILDGNNACRVVNVTGATLRHVTLTRGMSSEEACGGDAFVGLCGRLENCRATGILDYSKTMYAKGVVVYNNGGFVTGCLIDGNTVKASVRSIGYHQAYGAIDRSIIRNNKGIGVSPRSGFWIHAGFWIEGGGSMRNCIVTGNSQGTVSTSYSSGCGGSLGGNGSKMINCLVYDNTYSGIASTDMAGVVVGANATIVNSVVLGNGYVDTRAENFTGATRHMNNVTDKATAALCTGSFEGAIEDIFLVTDDGLDIKAGSDLVDAGAAQPVAEQGLDVCGRPRLGGERIDIGPFEYHVPPFAVTFESPVYFALDRIETTLTATASGDTEGTIYSWFLDAADTPFATGEDKQSVPLVLTELGTHTVTLKAVNGAGLADEFVQTYRVQQGTFVVNPGESIPDAIAAAEPGSTVLLKRGAHTNEALIVINKSIVLRGESRNETIITGTNMVRGVSLTALGATLADLTITDCRGNDYLKGGCAGVRLEAGTIMTNCIVRNCSTGNRNSGVGVYSADGKIYDCIISNNVGGVGTGFYQTGGSALMCRTFVLGNRSGAQVGGDNGFSLAAGGVLEGGEIRDSVIARNVAIVDRWNSWDKCTCSASGVFVKGGKLVNCTVVENEHTTPDNTTEYDYEGLIGGVGRRDGTIVNCLIAENYNVTTGGRADISVAINSFLLGYSTTCASPLALMPTDAGNVSSVPGPVYRYSKRLGEYRLTQGSPCAGAGTWQTWMEGALDIYGRAWNPDRVDIGAAVYDCKGLMLLLK